jgi:hypothetical protein
VAGCSLRRWSVDSSTQGAEVIPLRAADKPVLFISHRHEDRAIADVLRRFIEARSGGCVSVFQSSSPEAEGPRQGQNITEELRRALWHASVVVLVYTTRDRDWSYCMWECGVAQLPEPSDTKTIVFQCAEQFPSVFGDQLRVGLRSEDDIEKFVTALLTDPTYFPNLRRPIWEFAAGTEPVREAAHELYVRLQDVLPASADLTEEWPPYPQLTLELTDEQMSRIARAAGSPSERLATTMQIVAGEAVVIGGDNQVGRIFSVRGFPRNPSMPPVPLRDLISSWESNSPTPTSRWVEGICVQIMAAARDQFPTLRWEFLRGADQMDETWYGPMLRYVKRVARRKCTELDVVFGKFKLDDDNKPRVGVPELCDVSS